MCVKNLSARYAIRCLVKQAADNLLADIFASKNEPEDSQFPIGTATGATLGATLPAEIVRRSRNKPWWPHQRSYSYDLPELIRRGHNYTDAELDRLGRLDPLYSQIRVALKSYMDRRPSVLGEYPVASKGWRVSDFAYANTASSKQAPELFGRPSPHLIRRVAALARSRGVPELASYASAKKILTPSLKIHQTPHGLSALSRGGRVRGGLAGALAGAVADMYLSGK